MNILMLVSSLDCGGVQTHVVALARELFRRGNSVTVISSGGRMAGELSEMGVKHLFAPIDKKDPVSLYKSRMVITETVKRGSPDVIHAHSRIAALLAEGVAKSYGIPFTVTVHARFKADGIYGRLSRWGDASIAVSEDLCQYLSVNYGICPENVRVIPNGIDTERFRYKERKIRDGCTITFVSRLDKDCSEGAFLLCRIADRIKNEFPNVSVRICGGGECLSELKVLASDKPYIRFLGDVENMPFVLSDTDIFVGVSRAAMEAMSTGALVVLCGNEGYGGAITKVSELMGAAFSNFCCRGCEKMNEETLFEDIRKCLRLTHEERVKIGRELSLYVEKNYSVQGMAKSTEGVYGELFRNDGNKSGLAVLCGYYGFGNMGDNALLRSALKLVGERYPRMEILALTKCPKRDEKTFFVRCANRFSPFAVISAIRRADILIFGGGTLLQDRTSLRSLLYYSAIIHTARFFGGRVELFGNGLGEARGPVGKKLISSCLGACDRIGLRDGHSYRTAMSMIEEDKCDRLILEDDLAVTLQLPRRERLEYLKHLFEVDESSAPLGYFTVAVNGSCDDRTMSTMEDNIKKLISLGQIPLYISMFESEDGAESRRLARLLGGKVAYGISERDALGLIGGSTQVLSMRFHALVFAKMTKRPFLGYGGDPKIETFCRENGGVYIKNVY